VRSVRVLSSDGETVKKSCGMRAWAGKYGLTLAASRADSFGPPDDPFRHEHDAVCKVSATYLASTWSDARPREILQAGRRVYQVTGFEHDWTLAPQGHITGRAAVGMSLTPATEELFLPGFAPTCRRRPPAAL